MRKIFSIPFLIWLIISLGCNPVIDIEEFSSGDADFSTYVAIGNSLTAGYADDALYISGQKYSYPNILAQQFEKVGGGEFNIPFMPSEIGATWSPDLTSFPASLYYTSPKITLSYINNCKGMAALAPIRDPADADKIFDDMGEASSLYIGGKIYHNYGIPGITVEQVTKQGLGNFTFQNLLSGNFNPFYWRFAADQENSSVLSDALKADPTFFSLWIGNNDILGYAISGGEGNITPVNAFENALRDIISNLKFGKKDGVIANIPDITSIPFFITIPYNGLTVNDSEVASLNSYYSNNSDINFVSGSNAFIIEDQSSLDGYRKATAGDYILLSVPRDSLQCGTYGRTTPIPAEYVLTATEAEAVRTAVVNYNQIIKILAEEFKLAHVDINAFLASAVTGFAFDGINISTKFISGGVFSLDGVHPNPRGQALIANEFIKVINDYFGATVPFVDITDYPAILYP